MNVDDLREATASDSPCIAMLGRHTWEERGFAQAQDLSEFSAFASLLVLKVSLVDHLSSPPRAQKINRLLLESRRLLFSH